MKPGNAVTAVVLTPFGTSHSGIEDTRRICGSVIRAIDDDGVFGQATVLQHGAQLANALVKMHQCREQGGLRLVFTHGGVLLGRIERTVADIGRDIAEEWFPRCFALLDETRRIVEPDIGAESFVPGLLAIMPIPVVEVIVTPRIGDRCYRAVAMNHRFMKPSVDGAVRVEIAQVPFAEDARAISVGGKHVRSGGRFAGYQVSAVIGAADTSMPAMSSCHQGRPGGRAEGGDVIVREPDTFSMQFVQVRRLEPGMPMTPQVPVTLDRPS